MAAPPPPPLPPGAKLWAEFHFEARYFSRMRIIDDHSYVVDLRDAETDPRGNPPQMLLDKKAGLLYHIIIQGPRRQVLYCRVCSRDYRLRWLQMDPSLLFQFSRFPLDRSWSWSWEGQSHSACASNDSVL